MIKCLRWEIAAIAFPRLCVVGFSIAQPFLIGRVVSLLQGSGTLPLEMGYGVIGAPPLSLLGLL